MKNLRDFILKLDSAFKMYNGRCDMENEDNIFVFGYFFLLNTSHCVEAIEQHIRAVKNGVNKEPLGFDLQLEKCKIRLLNCRRILSDLKMFGDRSMDRYGYKYNDKPIANAKEMGLLIETNVNKIKDLLELLFYKVVLQGDDHFFEQYYLMFRNKLNTTNLKSEFEVCKMNCGEITMDTLKEQQAYVVADALKKGFLRYEKSPTKREMSQMKMDSLMDLLPYDYKLPDNFDKSYAKFKRFVSWDGDMMKLNYVRFGKYMICNKHKLDDADLKAFVKMDVLLEMINEEMRNLIIKAETETICENKEDKYWKRLIKDGFVDYNHQLLPGTSRKQAMYIAELFAEKLGIKNKWKYFEQIWNISRLAQEKWDLQQNGVMPMRYKEIDAIFAD